MASHQGLIQDQFTKQAVPFSKAMKDENALRLLVEFAGASSSDTVLDVAYGRGIVVCAFASVVAHATGIDLTPVSCRRKKACQTSPGRLPISIRSVEKAQALGNAPEAVRAGKESGVIDGEIQLLESDPGY